MKKVHRFFADIIWKGKIGEIVDRETVHQLSRVLRMKPGEELEVLDGHGMESRVRIIEILKTRIDVTLMGQRPNHAEPVTKVTLYAAILKKESFEWAIQKAVECGVHRIVPVLTAHTVKFGAKLDRLQAIAKEAAEQSGRAYIPHVETPMGFEQALQDARGLESVYFADTYLPDSTKQSHEKNVGLFIGPEGGWSDEERELAKRAGAKALSMGKLVLRGETACAIGVHRLCQEG